MGSESKSTKNQNQNSSAFKDLKAEERSLLKEKIQFLQASLNKKVLEDGKFRLELKDQNQSNASDSDKED